MKYGLRPPTKNEDLVRQQMWAAHRYRNTLVEIERGRRDAVRALYAQVGDLPALAESAKAADAYAAKVVAEVKAYKAERRTRKVPDELRDKLDAARIAKRDAEQAWKAAKRASRTEEMQAELDRINDLASELQRGARAHCGVYWGTYLLVEAAMDASRKAPYWGVMRDRVWYPLEPNNPSFLRWKGEGNVGVQIPKGLPTELVFYDDRRIQIERIPDRFGRPNSPWAILRLRVGSDERDPIWAEWPMKMHRPLPPGQIKGASVSLRRIGPMQEWTAQITVANEPIKRPSGDGAVGVNLGWRRVDGGIRVAYAVAEDGEEQDLVVDDELISFLQKADELKSIRDTHFDRAREELSAWLKVHDVPDWLRQRTKTMHAWKSKARMASLALFWKQHRFEGDGEAYDALERWRYRDHHLWNWESAQRAKSLRRRRDLYRVWSARLAERYHTIVVNAHDMSDTARKPTQPKEAETDNKKARANRQLVGPSRLREALANAKRTRSGETVQVKAAPVTQTCYDCGSLEGFDAAAEIGHTCSKCGAWWDQDANACRNSLRMYRKHPDDAKILGTAREIVKFNEDGTVKETKRQRVNRLRKEKEARKEAARNNGIEAP